MGLMQRRGSIPRSTRGGPRGAVEARGATVAAVALVGTAIVIAMLGCGKERTHQAPPMGLPIHALADTGPTERLSVQPPPLRLWVSRVSPAPPRAIAPALPDAPPDSSFPLSEAPALEIDEGLKPPILRTPAALAIPPALADLPTGRGAAVELDIQVDEQGNVSEVRWDGLGDRSLADAAKRCATAMRFFPALKSGRPVAVWCRQRFEVGGAGD